MAKNNLSENIIMKTLDFAYEKAVNGIPGLDSAQEMAENYMAKGGKKIDMANSLIRWQNTKAGTSGFLTGLPGLIAMPITLPANIASVLYVQVRMIAALAHLGGHDVKDDKVKSLVYLCMAGNGAKDLVKDLGIIIGKKVANQSVNNISAKTISAINQKVGFRLLTKFGQKGAINIGKAIPILGGLIGGTFDVVATNTIGNIARNTFVGKE
jgi:hypothetical protein